MIWYINTLYIYIYVCVCVRLFIYMDVIIYCIFIEFHLHA